MFHTNKMELADHWFQNTSLTARNILSANGGSGQTCMTYRVEAQAKGVMFGRKPSVDRNKVLALRGQGVGATAIAKLMKIGRATVYTIIQAAQK